MQDAKEAHPLAEKIANEFTFENIISKTIKNQRHTAKDFHSVLEIWNRKDDSLEKRTRLIAYLTEDQINVDELETVLRELFNLEFPGIFSNYTGYSSFLLISES